VFVLWSLCICQCGKLYTIWTAASAALLTPRSDIYAQLCMLHISQAFAIGGSTVRPRERVFNYLANNTRHFKPSVQTAPASKRPRMIVGLML